MPQLIPCPSPDCDHWNPPERKACWTCKADLTEVDVAAALREHRPRSGKGPWVLVLLLVVVAGAGAWWFLRAGAVAADSIAPELVIDSPTASELRTRAETLVVEGRVEDEHPDRVEAEGVSAPVEKGKFRLEVPVPSGGGSIRVVAFDRAGNESAPRVLRVEVDREPPGWIRLEPQDGGTAVTPTLVVSGEADEVLSAVTVAGRPGEVDGASFRAEAALSEGGNTILVTITDLAGNVAARSVSVTYAERRLPAGFTSAGRTTTGHELFTAAKDGARLVLVPGGSYPRGSDQGDADERPQREVELSPFFLQLAPVTNAQYARFCRETGTAPPPAPSFQSDYFTVVPNGPVVNVTWTEARAYAEWAGRTLPTEAQWELGARGPEGRIWPWGDEPGEAGVHFNGSGEADGFAGASPVGHFAEGASPFGLLDMAGNVWEWTADRYAADYYRNAPAKDPPGPGSGGNRSLRGGAFTSDLGDVRAANRWNQPASSRRDNVGFRTAAPFPG